MTVSIRTLPIVEKWDCHGCSYCCRGTTIALDAQDLGRLREQQWEDDPDFRGVKTVVRESLLGGRRVLAKQADGSCVFLTQKGRCRIHELHGAAAKPAVCQIFPFQMVSLDRFAYLTPVRSCPSAAADRGRPLKEHAPALKKSGLAAQFITQQAAPPIVRSVRRSWGEFLSAAGVLERLSTDERMPLVRRLVHGLQFCTLLDECRLLRVQESSWTELMQMLESSATDEAGQYFRERQPPSRGTTSLLRQAGVHYIRSHPGFATAGSWRERWQLMRVSMRFVRGKGTVPPIHPGFPEATFDSLEAPLGPLPDDVTRPLNRYFESHVVSKRYAIVGGRQSLVASYRVLALEYPMCLWLLRLAVGGRKPTVQDVTDMVVALERGRGMTAISRGATAMAQTRQLERLVAWYAR